jgi:hypothetical protein
MISRGTCTHNARLHGEARCGAGDGHGTADRHGAGTRVSIRLIDIDRHGTEIRSERDELARRVAKMDVRRCVRRRRVNGDPEARLKSITKRFEKLSA